MLGGGTRSRVGRPGPPAPRRLETTGMAAVVAHEPTDLTLTVEAGMTVEAVAELAASAGQCWPQAEVRPGSTVGGVLATAASSRGRLRARARCATRCWSWCWRRATAAWSRPAGAR